MPDRPLILGHRGSSARAPENTLAAFARALDDGADGIEFDVRLARNDVPVVIHDATLSRTGLLDRRVSELNSGELQKIDVGSWFHLHHTGDVAQGAEDFSAEKVPTLERVFEMFESNSAVLYLEMKCEANEGSLLAEQVASLISRMQMAKRVVVESFDLAAIARIKQVDPSIRTSALFEPKLLRPMIVHRSRLINLALQHGADELALHHALARSRMLDLARLRRLPVAVWTVDNPAWIERARLFGIKVLIANDPGPLVRVRNGSR